jgi:hypothetical protein
MRRAPSGVPVMRIVADTNTVLSGCCGRDRLNLTTAQTEPQRQDGIAPSFSYRTPVGKAITGP